MGDVEEGWQLNLRHNDVILNPGYRGRVEAGKKALIVIAHQMWFLSPSFIVYEKCVTECTYHDRIRGDANQTWDAANKLCIMQMSRAVIVQELITF